MNAALAATGQPVLKSDGIDQREAENSEDRGHPGSLRVRRDGDNDRAGAA